MKYVNISEKQINQIIEYSKKTFECSAHDFDHTLRVMKNALIISSNDARMDVLLPAIYLHDIARASTDKINDKSINHASEGRKVAEVFLRSIEVDEILINEICHCIESHNFKSTVIPNSKEAKILFDADKIDGLGAIGIARLYSMTGKYGNSLYELEEKQLQKKGKKNFVAPNLEFRNKHLKLIDRLYFDKSKEIAIERLEFMKSFFNHLDMEIGTAYSNIAFYRNL